MLKVCRIIFASLTFVIVFGLALEEDDTTSIKNLEFYRNEISSTPNGDFIENIHGKWFCNHELLEDHHGYVQWLFPIRESGMNFRSQPLSKHEAKVFRSTDKLRKRIIKSYEMMLDFYGIILLNEETGEIGRNPETYKSRYKDLNRSFHNYLRITRICKFLGVVGLEHYKFQFLNHMVLEVFQSRKLRQAASSCIRFWVPTLRRGKDVLLIDKLINKYYKRKLNREGKDGWGDEQGESWFTEFYVDSLSKNKEDKDHKKSFIPYTEIKTGEFDPFEKQRGEMVKIYEAKKEERKRKFRELRKKYGIETKSSSDEAWSSSDDDKKSKVKQKEKEEEEEVEESDGNMSDEENKNSDDGEKSEKVEEEEIEEEKGDVHMKDEDEDEDEDRNEEEKSNDEFSDEL